MPSRTCASTIFRPSAITSKTCSMRHSMSPFPPATRLPWAAATDETMNRAGSPARPMALLLQHGVAFVSHQQVVHVVCMLFFLQKNAFEHGTGAGIIIAEVADQLAVVIDGDPLGNQ